MSRIWKQEFTLEGLNGLGQDNLAGFLQMKFVEAGDDFLVMEMPITGIHKQPLGLLHGGTTAALAETLGSVASVLCTTGGDTSVVGVELNINHLSSASDGKVLGRVTPIRIGRTLHVWDIRIHHENGRALSAGRLTTMIKQPK